MVILPSGVGLKNYSMWRAKVKRDLTSDSDPYPFGLRRSSWHTSNIVKKYHCFIQHFINNKESGFFRVEPLIRFPQRPYWLRGLAPPLLIVRALKKHVLLYVFPKLTNTKLKIYLLISKSKILLNCLEFFDHMTEQKHDPYPLLHETE